MTVASLPLALQRGQQIEPAHLRHAHVGEDDVGPERVDQRERLLAALGDLDLVPCRLSSVRSTSRRFSSSSTTRTRRMICKVYHVRAATTPQIVLRRYLQWAEISCHHCRGRQAPGHHFGIR